MKQSHMRTPRSLAECSFFPSADPIERFHRDSRAAEWVVWAVVIVGAAAATVAVLVS